MKKPAFHKSPRLCLILNNLNLLNKIKLGFNCIFLVNILLGTSLKSFHILLECLNQQFTYN